MRSCTGVTCSLGRDVHGQDALATYFRCGDLPQHTSLGVGQQPGLFLWVILHDDRLAAVQRTDRHPPRVDRYLALLVGLTNGYKARQVVLRTPQVPGAL